MQRQLADVANSILVISNDVGFAWLWRRRRCRRRSSAARYGGVDNGSPKFRSTDMEDCRRARLLVVGDLTECRRATTVDGLTPFPYRPYVVNVSDMLVRRKNDRWATDAASRHHVLARRWRISDWRHPRFDTIV